MRTHVWTLAAAVAAMLFLASPSTAQVHFGPQVSLADDVDVGLGGRVVAGVPHYRGLEFAGTFDLFFPQGDLDYWELNGNLLYNFSIEGTTSVRPYAGGGLNIARFDHPNTGGNTEVGLNLAGGTKFATEGPLTPYLELRAEISGGEQIVLTAGALFP